MKMSRVPIQPSDKQSQGAIIYGDHNQAYASWAQRITYCSERLVEIVQMLQDIEGCDGVKISEGKMGGSANEKGTLWCPGPGRSHHLKNYVHSDGAEMGNRVMHKKAVGAAQIEKPTGDVLLAEELQIEIQLSQRILPKIVCIPGLEVMVVEVQSALGSE